MNQKSHLTRKEIANLLGVSVDTIERHEKKWGLQKFRSTASQKPFLYFREKTISFLANRGLIAE